MNEIDKLVEAIGNVERIMCSAASPALKYHLVFSGEDTEFIFATLKKLNIRLSDDYGYYDPDTSYEEDALALVRALNRLKNDLRNLSAEE